MATKFNHAQLQAIASRNKEILVSAGAGSGKSTVLVERLMQKIIQEKINVDQFLIVTFTNLAAREMVEKLRENLNVALAKDPHSLHLQQQLYKIPYANISTFHGFCNKILGRYYYLVDMDVNMQLMDEIEAVMLRADTLDAFMNEMYEDADLKLLVDVFGSDRSDEALADLLIKIYEIARANPDMQDWLAGLVGLYQIEGDRIDDWAFYSHVLALVPPFLDAAANFILEAHDAAIAAEMTDVPHGYVEMSKQDLVVINALRTSLETGTYDEMRNILMQTKLANFPTLSKKMKEHWDEAWHHKAKDLRNKFKSMLDTLRNDFFTYSNESHVLHFERGALLVDALARIVRLFHERFSAEKLALSKLDFSDLERLTLKMLTKNPEVLREIAADFNEIMIDEYQDTNDMQERIVKLISDSINVPMFMVGDVKQSIYRFRLAEPSIFQGKYAAYKSDEHPGLKIDLMQNYRSSRDVIDATNYLFSSIMDEAVGETAYDEDATLKLGIDEPHDPFNVSELHLIDKSTIGEAGPDMAQLSDAQLEAHHVAQQIKELVDKKLYVRGVGHRKVSYSDIVILMRSMTAATVFYDILYAYGIPASTEQPGDLLTETEVVTVLSLLRIIDNPYQDIPLVATMRSPLFFFNENELAQIRTCNKASSFYESVKTFATTLPATALHLKVQKFLLSIQDWRYESRFSTVATLLRKIYEQTSYYDFVQGMTGGKLRRANLDLLEEIAEDYEFRTTKGLYGFLHYIDQVHKLGKSIPKAKPETHAGESVKIMTIHKSKGLEFSIVFVTSLQKKFNIQDEIGDYVLHKNYGLGVQYINPELRLKQKTIVTSMLATTIHHEMLSEEMRLLYVALTRAKSKLILTGVMKDHEAIIKLADTDIAPTHARLAANRYLDWVLPVVADDNTTNPWQWQIITEIDAFTIDGQNQLVLTQCPPSIDFEAVFKQTYAHKELTGILAKQSVSQKKLDETVPMFKGIPESFKDNAYDQPSFIADDTRATEVGTAFHQFMQHLPVQDGHTLASITSLKDTLVVRGIIKAQLADKINLKDIYFFTKSYVYQQVINAHKIQKELPFTMLIPVEAAQAKVMLQGVVDLLAEFEDEVWIVDYKTDCVKDFDLQESQLRARYDIQMKYYLQAMRDIYAHKKVVAYVYFMRVNKLIAYE